MGVLNPCDLRYYHTASIYLMGIYLYNHLSFLKNGINNFLGSNDVREFLYSWFMTSFIHDFGYNVVQSKKPPMIWHSDCKIYISRKTYEYIEELLLDEIGEVLHRVIAENIHNYRQYKEWRYCKNLDKEFLDHGHFSGAYLIVNRKSKFEEKLNNNKLRCICDSVYIDIDTDLLWSRHILENTQRKVCQAIIGHNMFFCKSNSEDIEIYEKFNMGNLIIDNPVFNSREYPFFFLLQLVDTLDIFKSYNYYLNSISNNENQLIYEKILTDVDFEINKSELKIRFNNFDTEFIRSYWKQVRKQCYWLPIKVKKIKEMIIISFQ